MLDQLRAIFDQIIKFQNTQDTLFSRALFELELRKKKTGEIKENTEEVSERMGNVMMDASLSWNKAREAMLFSCFASASAVKQH